MTTEQAMTDHDTTPAPEILPCPGLAAHREARGLTQADLGTLTARSRRTVQRYEEATRAPGPWLRALAKTWRLPLEALTTEAPEGPDRTLARLALRYAQDLAALRDQAGPAAYEEARARVAKAQPQARRLLLPAGHPMLRP